MAVVEAVKESLGRGVVRVTWSGAVGGDTGAPAKVLGATNMVVQATGDATSVVLQGSNDGTNFGAFSTAVDLAGTTNEFVTLPDNVLYVQVSAVTGGSDTDVILVATTR